MADFERIAFLDEPPLAGVQWWQKSVQGEVSRRATLIALGLGGLALTAGCVALSVNCAKENGPERTENRAALEMQRRYGWSFGANGEVLTLHGLSPAGSLGSAQRNRLATLAFEPADARLKPFYQAALLEVTNAKPIEPPPADTSIMVPFQSAFLPVDEAGLGSSFRIGIAIARLFARLPEACALVIDLSGAQSVAVAAGAASALSPVLVMPNWPHPRGVVRSHQALAALAIFYELFTQASSTRKPNAPPSFVLDADRTLPVVSAEQDFDNRYRASVPSAAALKQLGIQHMFVLRAVSAVADEAKDLQARFTEWAAAGIPVHMLYASDFFLRFAPGSETAAPVESPLPLYAELSQPPSSFAGEADDLAAFRATYLGGAGSAYGSGGTWKPARPDPAEPTRAIGMVPVVVVGGVILGAQMARMRDSWSRGSGGGGG